jgi:hypothetical protein
MYFDDSLYENEMHFKISKYLDECFLDKDCEEIVIKCDNTEEYNKILDSLFKASSDKFVMYGTSINPMEIIVEKDPREDYRKFDENDLLEERIQ